MNLRLATIGFACLVVLGCGGPAPELSKKTEVVTWPALEALKAPEIGMGIFRSSQMGDYDTLKKTLADPKVEDAVKKFEDEPIPKKFATKAREDQKKTVVTEYKLLISGGKGGASFDELKRTADSLTQNINKLTDPALK